MRNSANPSPEHQLQLHIKQQKQQQQQQEPITLLPQHHAWHHEDCVATVVQPGAAATAARAPAEATAASQQQQQQQYHSRMPPHPHPHPHTHLAHYLTSMEKRVDTAPFNVSRHCFRSPTREPGWCASATAATTATIILAATTTAIPTTELLNAGN